MGSRITKLLGLTNTNCKLKTDLRQIPRSELKTKANGEGKSYIEVHYSLALTIESASMIFSLEYNGKTYGRVESKYE